MAGKDLAQMGARARRKENERQTKEEERAETRTEPKKTTRGVCVGCWGGEKGRCCPHSIQSLWLPPWPVPDYTEWGRRCMKTQDRPLSGRKKS